MARKEPVVEEPPVDPTGWLLTSVFAEFLLMHTKEIKYMCMFAYTFLHGEKVFNKLDPSSPNSYKFVNLIFTCTGGGTLVPIFINLVPVSLATDSYPIAIAASFLLHNYFPILRQVLAESDLLRAALIVMYETFRATVVVKLTTAAGAAIAPSDFSFPIFGPIFCGAIGGCGGAFFPLSKGLDPLLQGGLAPNMLSALIAATFYHLFVSTSISDDVIDAPKKAHIMVAKFFIVYGLAKGVSLMPSKKTPPASKAKKEN